MSDKVNVRQLPPVMFVTGIDTNIGKSVATGWLARQIHQQGASVITQKLIQTGNTGMSEDIEMHRRIMGSGLQTRDMDGTTAPIILSYPASPHLAFALDHRTPDYAPAERSAEILSAEYDFLLIEGAGGIMVPLSENMLTIDFVQKMGWPAIVVTCGRLGSINHTLLTADALKHKGIEIAAFVYNKYFDEDKLIASDTLGYLQSWAGNNYPDAQFLTLETDCNL